MNLSQAQRCAVHAESHCLILACPGAGKTYTVVARAKKILGDSPQKRIAIATFTRAAAAELKTRIKRDLGKSDASRVEIGTFHGLCYKQLSEATNDTSSPHLANQGDSDTFTMKAWHRMKEKFPDVRLNLETTRRHIDFYKTFGSVNTTPEESDAIIFAAHFLKNLTRAHGLVLTDDIIPLVNSCMEVGLIKPLNVTDLLVDEFQDVDPPQFSWVMTHLRNGVRVTCVGDDDQSIYGFRHSLGYEGMRSFVRESYADTVKLDATYRCSINVIYHANRLINHNKKRAAKDIYTNNQDPGTVIRRDFPHFDQESDAIVNAIRDKPKSHSMAILVRTNELLTYMEVILQHAGLPYIGGMKKGIWDEALPSNFFRVMGSVLGINPIGAKIALTLHGMSNATVEAAGEDIAANGGHMGHLLVSHRWLKEASADDLKVWEKMKAAYRRVTDTSETGVAAFASACSALVTPGYKKLATPKYVRAIMDILCKMDGDLHEIYDRIKESIRSPSKEVVGSGCVSLLTLHRSKGLEFDEVWMPAMWQGTLPFGDENVDEERRLCYVGMTRAKSHLTLSLTRGAKFQDSIFLEEAGLPRHDKIRLKSEFNW